ncbi:MAG: helix-turn-helix transcriptional regulator [Clostridiales bacterium]|nr:helix-turn-helix transcriptional regulator [Clostridiales bacterium]
MSVEKKLAEIIASKCINVKALAEKADVKYQTLARCLRGEQELKADEFIAVCKTAGINLDEFLAA